jgi:hypothetical protein
MIQLLLLGRVFAAVAGIEIPLPAPAMVFQPAGNARPATSAKSLFATSLM